VMDQVSKSDLSEAVRYFGPKTLEEIVAAIAACNVGIIPNRRSIFTEINTPTRIFEYLSQAKPVIAPRTRGIQDYFGPDQIVPFELGDVDDLAVKIEYVFKHPEEIRNCVKRGQEVYLAHRWSNERLRFVNLLEKLLNPARLTGQHFEGSSVSAVGSQKCSGWRSKRTSGQLPASSSNFSRRNGNSAVPDGDTTLLFAQRTPFDVRRRDS
jgi:hypothetical protein